MNTPQKLFSWDDFKSGKCFVRACDDESKNLFLRQCEEQGIRWASGDKATDWNVGCCFPIDFAYDFRGMVYAGGHTNPVFESPGFEAKAVLKDKTQGNPVTTIVIRSDGNKTSAIMKEGKKLVACAEARRNPHDEPDVQSASFLCIARLFKDKYGLSISEEPHDIGWAIRKVKAGKKATRKGWNGKGQYICLASEISYRTPEGTIVKPTHIAYGNQAIAFVGTSGTQLGWLASQADLLAQDWELVE